MKAILLSIRPEWIAKILNGEKTIEVRKRFPKDYKGWVYIYCTKEDSLIKLQEKYKDRYICEQEFRCDDFPKMYSGYEGKGKVVARFYCDKVEEISYNYRGDFTSVYTDTLDTEDLENQTCLTKYEFANYLQGDYGYAIHISQLEIFDEPKELSEFHKIIANDEKGYLIQLGNVLTKAPQSFMFIEV